MAATLKYWNGSIWVPKTLKFWNGSAWVAKPLKFWNGSAWVGPSAGGIVAPVFRSVANTTYTSRNDTDIPVPAGVALNDILLALLVLANNTGTITPPVIPGGWAQIDTMTAVSDGGTGAKMGIYWKRASASEPASYQWAQFEPANTQGVMAAYSGCPTAGSPVDVVSRNSSNGSGTTATGTGVTTTQANDRLVWAGHNWDASGTLSPPAEDGGMTERFDHLTYVADQVIAAAGATGNRTQTQASTNSPWATFLIALKGI